MKIICQYCEENVEADSWIEGEHECDSCGYHVSFVCPECYMHTDHVWSSSKYNEIEKARSINKNKV